MPGLVAAAPEGAADQPALLDFLGKEHDLLASVEAVTFLGDTLAATSGDGLIWLIEQDASPRPLKVHDGAILSSSAFPDQKALLTAGDDGLLRRTDVSGRPEMIASSSQWIDSVGVGASGSIAWSSGKFVYLRKRGTDEIAIKMASTCQSLAFSPDGSRLAIAQYGGIRLIDLKRPAKIPLLLPWEGAHLRVRWSPDSRFLVSAMLENELHVWDLSNGAQGRMGNYPTRPLSFAWSSDGRMFATSGADCIVLWPFVGNTGPIGSSATVSLRSITPVCAIAWHPGSNLVAAGHRDGSILFFNSEDNAAALIRRPDGSPVTSVAFSIDGKSFGYGCGSGAAGRVATGDEMP